MPFSGRTSIPPTMALPRADSTISSVGGSKAEYFRIRASAKNNDCPRPRTVEIYLHTNETAAANKR